MAKNKPIISRSTDIKYFERMIVELSPHMTEMEIDQCLSFLETISSSKFDLNPTIDDCKSQLRLIVGSQRYEELVWRWTDANQPLLKEVGKKKFKRLSDGTLWDGLDPEDRPEEYKIIYI